MKKARYTHTYRRDVTVMGLPYSTASRAVEQCPGTSTSPATSPPSVKAGPWRPYRMTYCQSVHSFSHVCIATWQKWHTLSWYFGYFQYLDIMQPAGNNNNTFYSCISQPLSAVEVCSVFMNRWPYSIWVKWLLLSLLKDGLFGPP